MKAKQNIFRFENERAWSVATLEPGEDVDAEEEWVQEAERRYQAYRRASSPQSLPKRYGRK
ncbi:MAG: hypothetical protein C4293_19390 [Nitrospiraceae bacterium]